MKKQLVIAITLALLSVQGQAENSFYGKANVSLQALSEKTLDGNFTAQDNYELISNKSRFGLKGDESINDDIKALYQFEWELAVDSGDTGSGQALKQRNSYVGLGGKWGSVLAGIHDTPTKLLNKQIDIFNELRYGDLENTVVGEVRHKNMLLYRSPVWSGFNLDLMIAPGEDKGSDSLQGSTANDKRSELANAVSAAVSYVQGGFRIGVGIDNKVEQKLSIGSIDLGPDKRAHATALPSLDDVGSKFSYEGETDLARLVASYDDASFGVAGLLQHARQSQGDLDTIVIVTDISTLVAATTKYGKADVEELDTLALGGYVKVAVEWKLKVLGVQTRLAESDTQFDQLVVGVDYQLGKNTALYGYASRVKAVDGNMTWGNNSTIGVGIEHGFAF